MIRVFAFILALVVAFALLLYLVDFGSKEDSEIEKQIIYKEKVLVVPEKVSTTKVYSAVREIKVGELIEPDMYKMQDFPTKMMNAQYIIADTQNSPLGVTGMVARAPIYEGDILMMSKLQNPDDPSYISSSLGEGMRAVTINVNPESSVAGFVQPGDKVDVVLSFSVSKLTDENQKNLEGSENPYSSDDPKGVYEFAETVLANVRVLAIDQSATSTQGTAKTTPNTVTLELTPVDSQKIILSKKLGPLSLVLRGLETDSDEEEMTRPVGLSDITRLFPPSYFPVLFENDTDYVTSVVNVFEDGVDGSQNQVLTIEDIEDAKLLRSKVLMGEELTNEEASRLNDVVKKIERSQDGLTADQQVRIKELIDKKLSSQGLTADEIAELRALLNKKANYQYATDKPSYNNWFEKKRQEKQEELEAVENETPKSLKVMIFRGSSKEDVEVPTLEKKED